MVEPASPTKPTFEAAVDYVIDVLEGGDRLVHDEGGATKYGIAQRYHPGVDVEHLTREGAVAIYRREYWDALRCSEMPPALGVLVFDLAVNPGPGVAAGLLQEELRVERDGVVGPDTLDAARRASPAELLAGLTARRIEYYRRQVAQHPPKIQWWNGWLRRSAKMLLFAARYLA